MTTGKTPQSGWRSRPALAAGLGQNPQPHCEARRLRTSKLLPPGDHGI